MNVDARFPRRWARTELRVTQRDILSDREEKGRGDKWKTGVWKGGRLSGLHPLHKTETH